MRASGTEMKSQKVKRVDKNGRHLRLGDKVRITGISPGVVDTGEFKTRTILERCVGRVFPVKGFQKDCVELHLGKLVGKRSWEETIWVEPEVIELVRSKHVGRKRARSKPKPR